MQSKKEAVLYPIKFKDIYKKKIWAGNMARSVLGRAYLKKKVGEIWKISVAPRNMSIINNGAYKGIPLIRILEKWRREIMGDEYCNDFAGSFPLTIKFLDIKDKLSLQVHHSDEYAQRN